MMFNNELKQYIRTSLIVLAAIMIQGCFHSKNSTPVPDADPTGYYDSGKSDTLGIGDFQAVVKDNRIMMMSTVKYVLYDGTMSISGNDYTATVTVYKDGVSVGSGSITGTITAGSSITGDITGTTGGTYDGDFTVTYAQANDTDTASLSKTNATWRLTDDVVVIVDMVIDSSGTITGFTTKFSPDNYLKDCSKFGTNTVTHVTSTNLYAVSMNIEACANIPEQGGYTGHATTKTNSLVDDTLVLMFSEGNYAVYGDFAKQ